MCSSCFFITQIVDVFVTNGIAIIYLVAIVEKGEHLLVLHLYCLGLEECSWTVLLRHHNNGMAQCDKVGRL